MARACLRCAVILIVIVVGMALVVRMGDAQDCVCRALQTIRFAQTAPLTGSNAQAGVALRDGILAAFTEYNEFNSDDKKFRLELQTKDDKYDAQLAKQNALSFVQDPQVFGFIGATGTANIENAGPVAIANDLPFMSAYGGMSLRMPFQRHIITVRSAYYDEAASMVEFMVAQGRERIAIYVQRDAFGAAAREGVLAALDSNNLYLHSEAWYTKNMNASVWTNEADQALSIMANSSTTTLPPNAIVIGGAYEPSAIFIRQLREVWPDAYVVTISFATINALISLLAPTSNDTHLLNNLYSSQFLPNPAIANDPVVQSFRAAATHIGVSAASYSGLEGYLMGRLAITALESIKGFSLTPQAFMDAIYRESFFMFDNFDIGPFYPASIENGCNQGIHGVRIAQVFSDKSLADVFSKSFTTCGYQRKLWNTLTFGQSCSFSGGQSTLCGAFRDGLLAAFKQVNDAGGIQGTTRLLLSTKDDQGDPLVSLLNNQVFLDDPGIFGLIGTSTVGIDDVVQLMNLSNKVMFGAFSGAQILRKPFLPQIINFRASNSDELHAIVHHCYRMKQSTKVSVLYEATAYGRSLRDMLETALQEKRWSIFSESSFANNSDIGGAVSALFAQMSSHPDVVVFIGLGDVIVEVLLEIQSRDSQVLVFGLSTTVVTSLMKNATASSKVNLDKFRMTSSVPHPHDMTLDVVQQYSIALAKLDPLASVSSAGLEGFIVGQLVAIALSQVMGREVTTQSLQMSMYDSSIFHVHDFTCGPFSLGTTSSTRLSCNQCMKRVYLVSIELTKADELLSFDDSCMYIPTANLDFALKSTRMVMVIIAIIAMIYTLLVGIFVVVFRPGHRIKSMLACSGGLLCSGFIFVLYPVPTDLTCVLQPWIGDLAFLGLIGPLFAKVFCMARLASNKRHKNHQRERLTDLEVFKTLLLVACIFLIFLVVHTTVDPPRVKEFFTPDGRRFEHCSTNASFFKYADNLLKGVFLLWGSFLSQRLLTSKKFTRFTDSKALAICVIHASFLAFALTLVGLTTSNSNPNLDFMSNAVVLVVNTVVTITVLQALPLYKTLHSVSVMDDTSQQFSSGGSATAAGPRIAAIVPMR